MLVLEKLANNSRNINNGSREFGNEIRGFNLNAEIISGSLVSSSGCPTEI